MSSPSRNAHPTVHVPRTPARGPPRSSRVRFHFVSRAAPPPRRRVPPPSPPLVLDVLVPHARVTDAIITDRHPVPLVPRVPSSASSPSRASHGVEKMTAAPRDPTALFLAPRQSRGSAAVVVLVRRRPTRPSSNDVFARGTFPPRADSRPSLSSRQRPPVRSSSLARPRVSHPRRHLFIHSIPWCIGFTSRPRGGRGVVRRGGDSIDRSVGRDSSIDRGLDGPCPR